MTWPVKMHDFILRNFDWPCYRNVALSRFLDGRKGAVLSNGFHNLACLAVLFFLVRWAFLLWVEFSAIEQTMSYMSRIRKVVFLGGLSEFAEDLMVLTREHFNLVVKSRQEAIPMPVTRIRMPACLNAGSIQVCETFTEESIDRMVEPVDDLASPTSLDSLGVSFTIDCNRTTFMSAHWGVPVSALREICVDAEEQLDESQKQMLHLKRFFQNLVSSIFSDAATGLLDEHQSGPTDGSNIQPGKLGRFNLLAYTKKICSNPPICYDAGTGIHCMVSPPVKTIKENGEEKPIWDALLKTSYEGEEIVPLVVVIYSPRVQDTRVFSEGWVESYQGIAEITLVSFRGSISYPLTPNSASGTTSSVKIDMHKQVCFSNDFQHPQEPREMYGMGDTESDCLICITNKMDTLLLPCGHAGFCYICLKSLRNDKCPVCRGVFTSYIRFPLAGTPNSQ